MIVNLSNNGRLKIDKVPLLRMESYRQDTWNKLEAGGVLLGRLIRDSKYIIIDRVTVPMIADKRTRNTFIRNEKIHQNIIDNVWERTKGTCNYLGEWHTHPENYPKPSRQDYRNWENILTTGSFSSLYIYFVIVGIKETRIWEGNRRTKKITRLYIE